MHALATSSAKNRAKAKKPERVASLANEGATPRSSAPAPRDANEEDAPVGKWGVGDAGEAEIDPLAPEMASPEAAETETRRESIVDDAFHGFDRFIARSTGPRLGSIAKETWVRAEPSRHARRIGYLRAGAIVQRGGEPEGFEGCKGGWYKIEPRGYVCIDRTATLDLDAPQMRASRTQPRMDGLPYDYAIARLPGPVFYTRVPTPAEQNREESDLGFHMREAKAMERDSSFVAPPHGDPLPGFLLGGDGHDRPEIPGLGDGPPRGSELTAGQAKPRAGFALLETYDVGGRPFGLTTDLDLIPLDRTRIIVQSKFHGIELGSEATLPVAFVMKHHTTHFVADASGQMRPGASLDYREAVPITGKEKGGGAWLEAKDGSWLRVEDVRRVDAPHRMPAWATGSHKWIDVSILHQSLVAYEGTTPKYVTLVSTGADGLGDPKTTHSTIQGIFLIHTKHVSVTMDNDDANDAFDLRDVPFVQYFNEGYALHAAYWHDDFGTPRSHGCVNLAPIDAAWLFGFTTPDVPDGWHAALTLHKGTLVYTHP